MAQPKPKDLTKRPPTLFEISVDWVPLLEARIAAETDPDLSDDRPLCLTCHGRGFIKDNTSEACPTCEGSARTKSPREIAIEEADVALANHAQSQIEKADSYIGLIGYLEAAIATRKAERDRHAKVAGILERALEQVKATAVFAITAVPGRKRVDGDRGYLLAKANGGLAPLLTDDAMLPDDVCKFEGWINVADFATMLEAARRRRMDPQWKPRAKFDRKPDNALIREKLAEPCPTCGGKGTIIVTGADQMSVEALQAGATSEERSCMACGGSGTAGVPGARLGERGTHLEIK